MRLEQSFEVAAPLEQVWHTLVDVEHVAPCLPGAAVTGRNDDGSYNGTFTVKIGPTTASYTGRLEMQNIDEASHTATMQAQGTDKRGQGGAKATILSRVAPIDGQGTRVDVVTDYHITGRLARFGRGGMIEDISARLLREFAKRLQTSLDAQPQKSVAPAEAAPAEAAPAAAAPAAAAEDLSRAETVVSSSSTPAEEPVASAPSAPVEEPVAPAMSAPEEGPVAPAWARTKEPPAAAPEPTAAPPEEPAPPAWAPPEPPAHAEHAAPESTDAPAPFEPTHEPEPAAATPEPAAATPEPAAATPEPAAPTPEPEPAAPTPEPAVAAYAGPAMAEAAAHEPPPPHEPPPVAPPPPPPPLDNPPMPSEPMQGLSLVGSVVWGRVKRNPAPVAAAGVAVVLLMARRRRRRHH